MRGSFLLTLLTSAALLTSCAKDSEPMPAPVYLLDQRWELVELEGQAISAQPGSTATDLVLSAVGSTNSGRAACNTYGGQYTLAPGSPQLRFGTQASTYATCAAQSQETRYLELLPQVTRYTISNHQLSLYDAAHAQPLLVYKAAK
ncbi:META domain-containing protein [Hymenobacter tenuis]